MTSRSAGGGAHWSGLTALVGDPTRLRLIRLLAREELGVGELARVLQLPQSTVSRHLKVLLDASWAQRRNQGTASLYLVDPARLGEPASALWEIARRQITASSVASDDARLAGVLADRRTDSRTFFGRVGGEWDALRRQLFGTAFATEALLSLVDPAWTIADLGCGTGDVAEQLAPLVKKVVAIDREPNMIEAAKKRLARAGNVIFRIGDLLSVPLRDEEVDMAVIMLVLHHVEHPDDALRACARALRPGGRLLVVDMVRHDRELYARTMGHRHLGFEERDGRAWSKRAGLELRRWHLLRADAGAKGPGLFAALFERGGSIRSSSRPASSTSR